MLFDELFNKARGNAPYPYQKELAVGVELPELIDVPTGCGKTAAVVLSWVWRRRFGGNEVRTKTPRRLVYCLPMRVLVEQTRDECVKWLKNLGLLAGRVENGEYKTAWKENGKHHSAWEKTEWKRPEGDCSNEPIAVTVLMGGEDEDEWDLYPDRDAIIIGTQDMLLSRALNRGYGMSRYRWPMHFGLLNNDSLWIMDEVQLMGVGLETTSQMDAFRKKFGTYGPVLSIWMSATQDPKRLDTIDAKQIEPKRTVKMAKTDYESFEINKRVSAIKELIKTEFSLEKSTGKDYPKKLAEFTAHNHKPGTFTLVILNSVSRAQETYQQLKKVTKDQKVVLLHSRFRPKDREHALKIIGKGGDLIAISTQVVEAGVDISSKTLITELAPWSSMVQRFGRCNRRGEFDRANVHWVDIETSEGGFSSPYYPSDLDWARNKLSTMSKADISSLMNISSPEDNIVRPVIRRKDLLDLFDTTPDLTGTDLDISQYIRDSEDIDIQVYWRDIIEERPSNDDLEPHREELCPVLLDRAKKFFEKKNGWVFDHLEKQWIKIGRGSGNIQIRPGLTILIPSSEGGYSNDEGWIGLDGKKPVIPIIEKGKEPNQAMGEDEDHREKLDWVSLVSHCRSVSDRAVNLCHDLKFEDTIMNSIQTAGLWHDVGKAHPAFQNMLKVGLTVPSYNLWAKSDHIDRHPDYFINEEEKRPYFRHELASALAWIQDGPEGTNKDLVTYLIGAHHGKIRLSIRSLPQENEPKDTTRLFARGVWHGDELPIIPGITTSEIKLDLTPILLGEGSWIEKALKERDRHGPFVLSFYETIMRIADWTVSRDGG